MAVAKLALELRTIELGLTFYVVTQGYTVSYVLFSGFALDEPIDVFGKYSETIMTKVNLDMISKDAQN